MAFPTVCQIAHSTCHLFSKRAADDKRSRDHITRCDRGEVSVIASAAVAAAFALTANADDSFRVLHAFDNAAGAAVPYSSPTLIDGWVYGTTAFAQWGGSAPEQSELRVDGGALYRLRPDGSGFEVLKHFSAQPGSDAYLPFQGLTRVGTALIGTAWSGGTSNGGTLYSIDLDGSGFQVLHSFGAGTDGAHPYVAPIRVGEKLFGMTAYGGPNPGGGTSSSLGAGVLYSYDLQTGAYNVARAFQSPGSMPLGGLTQIGDWLYGMVSDHRNTNAFGDVFRYRPTDQTFEIVHAFTGGTSGGYPYDSLTWDGGNFVYGTTLGFYPFHPLQPLDIAALADEGVVFRFDLTTLEYKVIHDFTLSSTDGAKPNSSMLVAPDGYLYGIAHGSEGLGAMVNGVRYGTEPGTLYRLHPDGSDFTVLHTFNSLDAGYTPMRGLVWDNGTIYGTTAKGGISVDLGGGLWSGGSGTVWSYTVYAVPEPSALVIAAGGLVALFVHRRAWVAG